MYQGGSRQWATNKLLFLWAQALVARVAALEAEATAAAAAASMAKRAAAASEERLGAVQRDCAAAARAQQARSPVRFLGRPLSPLRCSMLVPLSIAHKLCVNL